MIECGQNGKIMIHYTMLGTNNSARSIRFYDPLFQEMGMVVRWRDEHVTS